MFINNPSDSRSIGLSREAEGQHEENLSHPNVLLALAVLLVVWMAESTYRKKNICAPGDRPIQSEADAIKQAKIRIGRANYMRHEIYRYVDVMPELVAWDEGDACCKVIRARNIFGVIIWNVVVQGKTEGEATERRVDAEMSLSNCGAGFTENSFISAKSTNMIQ